MSLLSGLFTELEKVPAPRFAVRENVAHTTAPAAHLEQHQQPSSERTPECRKQHRVRKATPVEHLLPDMAKEAEDPPQHYMQTAVTASREWLAARNAFYNHIMPCRSCHAPTGRYCLAGADLRQRYDQTPMVNDERPSRSELETLLTPALTPTRGKRDASPQRSRTA